MWGFSIICKNKSPLCKHSAHMAMLINEQLQHTKPLGIHLLAPKHVFGIMRLAYTINLVEVLPNFKQYGRVA